MCEPSYHLVGPTYTNYSSSSNISYQQSKPNTSVTDAIFMQTPSAGSSQPAVPTAKPTPPTVPPRVEQIHSQSHIPTPHSSTATDAWLLYENQNDACCFMQQTLHNTVSPHVLSLTARAPSTNLSIPPTSENPIFDLSKFICSADTII